MEQFEDIKFYNQHSFRVLEFPKITYRFIISNSLIVPGYGKYPNFIVRFLSKILLNIKYERI